MEGECSDIIVWCMSGVGGRVGLKLLMTFELVVLVAVSIIICSV